MIRNNKSQCDTHRADDSFSLPGQIIMIRDTGLLVRFMTCVAVACGLVLGVGIWGMQRDLHSIQKIITFEAILQVKTHAERSAVRLETEIAKSASQELSEVAQAEWLREHWQRTRDQEPRRVYRAVVDIAGKTVAHTNPSKIGQSLTPSENAVSENVQLIESPRAGLAGERLAWEVLVPIRVLDRFLGTYHVGLSRDWLDAKIRSECRATWLAWSVVLGTSVVIVLISGAALYRLACRATSLVRELHLSDSRRMTELNELMIGMAHEIRNPLNSIRLNLHTSERVFRGDTFLDREETFVMLRESVREIERVDNLIGQLLGYVQNDNGCDELIDVSQEIQATLRFTKADFESCGITMSFREWGTPVGLRMDRRRLRQILLNLLSNARYALSNGGCIEITLVGQGDRAQLIVSDSGKGVSEEIRSRIFEPFFSTLEDGTGLGLAIVRSILESVSGAITYRASESLGGAEFVLSFPSSRLRKLIENAS